MHNSDLRAWREALGLKQTRAAELLNLSRRAYINYEDGLRPVPDGVEEACAVITGVAPKDQRLAVAEAMAPGLMRASALPKATRVDTPDDVQRFYGVPESDHHSGVPVEPEFYSGKWPYRINGHDTGLFYTPAWEGDRAWKELPPQRAIDAFIQKHREVYIDRPHDSQGHKAPPGPLPLAWPTYTAADADPNYIPPKDVKMYPWLRRMFGGTPSRRDPALGE